MAAQKVYEFSKHMGALCARAGKNVYDLAPKLGLLPSELLAMINGRVKPTKAVIAGLAKELDSDVRYLERLAAAIEPE
jgi:plasmid maintenance system antidote protein VapI